LCVGLFHIKAFVCLYLNPAIGPAMNLPLTNPSWMEPLLPPEEGQKRLEDAAFDLVSRASSLAGQTNPIVSASIGTLVRSMNCYYSNLIEGHDTHPRDIDKALRKDYSAEPARRISQLEAVAHIAVEKAIDEGRDPGAFPASLPYVLWLHREFYHLVPDELLWVEDPASKTRIRIRPGELRDGEVEVGRHLPPEAEALP